LLQHRAKRKYFLVAIDKEQLACPITNRNPSGAIKAFTIMIIAFDIEGCDVSDSCIQYHHLYHRDRYQVPKAFQFLRSHDLPGIIFKAMSLQ
jgi:hypothetical protein